MVLVAGFKKLKVLLILVVKFFCDISQPLPNGYLIERSVKGYVNNWLKGRAMKNVEACEGYRPQLEENVTDGEKNP